MVKEPSIRFLFVKRPRKKEPTRDEQVKLNREIQDYLKDLSNFKVSLRQLCDHRITFEDRNRCLNIALSLINHQAISASLVGNKSLPILAAAKETGYNKTFLQRHEKYIIAYMLLFGSSNYSLLSRQLNIGTSLEGSGHEGTLIGGLKIKKYGPSAAVLTPLGEFTYLDPKGQSRVGDVITGQPALISPGKAKIIALVIAGLILLTAFFSYIFYSPVKSYAVAGRVNATFSFNRFNKLIHSESTTYRGREVVQAMVASDQTTDASLDEFLRQAIAKKYLAPYDEITVVVLTGQFNSEEFQTKRIENRVKTAKVRLKINLGQGKSLLMVP